MRDDQDCEQRRCRDRRRGRFAPPGDCNCCGAKRKQRHNCKAVMAVGENQQKGAEQVAGENPAGDEIVMPALAIPARITNRRR